MEDVVSICLEVIIAIWAGKNIWRLRMRRYLVFYKLINGDGNIIEGNLVFKDRRPICQSNVMNKLKHNGLKFEKGTITNFKNLSKQEFKEWCL